MLMKFSAEIKKNTFVRDNVSKIEYSVLQCAWHQFDLGLYKGRKYTNCWINMKTN